MSLSKRMKEAHKAIGTIESPLSLQEAVNRLAKAPKVKFDETVELHFNLNLDLKASDQGVRGTVVLPHGIGKWAATRHNKERASRCAENGNYIGNPIIQAASEFHYDRCPRRCRWMKLIPGHGK